MELLENPSRIRLKKILLLTEYPHSANVAVAYTFGLAHDYGARMHIVYPESIQNMAAGSARWHDFDLVVVSFEPARATGKRTIGNSLKSVFQAIDCPAIVIGPSVDRGVAPRIKPATIVHATDFSPYALAAAQHAFSWAQEYQSWITLLHVIDDGGCGAGWKRRESEQPFRDWMRQLVPPQVPLWCEVEHRVEFGEPAEKILQAAEELHADLLVVGLMGMDTAAQDGLGSTALEVISRASCPVLVVRDYMKAEALPVHRQGYERRVATTA